jgi:primosomal protein N' (replication factor Y) (superfamily II helicase)
VAGGSTTVRAVPLLGVRALASRSFDYAVPGTLAGMVGRGSVVGARFGGRLLRAVVVAEGASGEVPSEGLSELQSVEPHAVSTELLEVAEAMSRRYLAPLGACLQMVVQPRPGGKASRPGRAVDWVRPIAAFPLGERLTMKQGQVLSVIPPEGLTVRDACLRAGVSRGVVEALVGKTALTMEKRRVAAAPHAEDEFDHGGGCGEEAGEEPLALSGEQTAALAGLEESLDSPEAARSLLWGITGSGKTEVYLALISRVLDSGGSALVLVPEIALTVNAVRRFRGRFGSTVGVLHSGLAPAVRAREYERILSGEVRVVVGARSAVFAPVSGLRLVVVDEAHDASYKQEEEPRYDARWVAWWRVSRNKGLLVEGTATPRTESLAQAGTLLRLSERPSGAVLPEVEVVDLRRQGGDELLAPRSQALVGQALSRGEQVILLLNRRGYAAFLHCEVCGRVLMCPHCEISLTYHRAGREVMCHYCGYHQAAPSLCPSCGAGSLSRGTPGTERLDEELRRLAPASRVFRLDSDVATSGTRVQRVLRDFERTRPGLLVGTQMVAKGHDFELVSLVVVADADTGLCIPDFRAAERTFQLLTQVIGRAGRRQTPGRAVVQTWNPDIPCIRMAVQNDAPSFYRLESATRERLGYPPFRELVRIVLSSRDEERLEAGARYLAERLAPHVEQEGLLGPARLPIVRSRSRYHLLLRSRDGTRARRLLARALDALRGPYARRGIDIMVDVDPEWFN